MSFRDLNSEMSNANASSGEPELCVASGDVIHSFIQRSLAGGFVYGAVV